MAENKFIVWCTLHKITQIFLLKVTLDKDNLTSIGWLRNKFNIIATATVLF